MHGGQRVVNVPPSKPTQGAARCTSLHVHCPETSAVCIYNITRLRTGASSLSMQTPTVNVARRRRNDRRPPESSRDTLSRSLDTGTKSTQHISKHRGCLTLTCVLAVHFRGRRAGVTICYSRKFNTIAIVSEPHPKLNVPVTLGPPSAVSCTQANVSVPGSPCVGRFKLRVEAATRVIDNQFAKKIRR